MYHLAEAYLMAAYICVLAAFLGAAACGAAFAGVASAALHRFAVIMSAGLAVACALGSVFSAVPLVYASLMVSLAALMAVCFFSARMVGRNLFPGQRPASGGSARMVLAGVAYGLGVVAGIALLAGLVYVLPGQFTFWPTQGGLMAGI